MSVNTDYKTETNQAWTLKQPVTVEFGPGSIKKISQYLSGYKKALLVTQLFGTPAEVVIEQIAGLLLESQVETKIFSEFTAEPSYQEIEKGAALARDFQADIVVAYGGGSSMDTAKLIAVAATHMGSVLGYRVGGTKAITAVTLPIIVIPSTSGTGSHVGRVAVVSEPEMKSKRFMASDYLYPRVAFCDAEILRYMPPEITATSGFDAFAQALESYLSNSENPMGNLCAQEAMRIISRVLPCVYDNGRDLELRSAMAWADTLQGYAMSANAVLTPHVIAMVLGGRYHIPHARAIASVMPACLRHSKKGAIDKFATVARLMGCPESYSPAALADWTIEAVEKLIEKIGLRKSPAAYGVPEEEYEQIAQEVKKNFSMRLDADPVAKNVPDLIAILQQANK
jgi:alcohol dehydrogenase class IV